MVEATGGLLRLLRVVRRQWRRRWGIKHVIRQSGGRVCRQPSVVVVVRVVVVGWWRGRRKGKWWGPQLGGSRSGSSGSGQAGAGAIVETRQRPGRRLQELLVLVGVQLRRGDAHSVVVVVVVRGSHGCRRRMGWVREARRLRKEGRRRGRGAAPVHPRR